MTLPRIASGSRHASGRVLCIAVLCASVLAGCMPPRPVEPPMTQLQMREMQTRGYPNRDTRMVMKALINALQDEGFMVRNADKELGFISASKEVDVSNSTEEFLARLANGPAARFRKNSTVEASANVSEFGQETRVRVIFQIKVVDNFNSPLEIRQVEDLNFYQGFFSKVDKSLFYEREKL